MSSVEVLEELKNAVLGGLTFAPCTLEIVASCPSTNAHMLERAQQGAPSGSVLVALTQTAGRGRQGRTWYAPPGGSLSFSLFHRFAPELSLLGLPLAVGCACRAALDRLGVPAKLKWPNDLMLGERKLGGILIEMAGPGMAVIGIGLNVRRSAELPDAIASTAAFLDDGQAAPSWVILLTGVLNALGEMLPRFAARGFAAFRQDWLNHALWLEQPVVIHAQHWRQHGVMKGIDQDGALLLASDRGVQRILVGDVSLRSA